MEIKLFSLCNQDSPTAESGKDCIYNCLLHFFPECEYFTAFSSQKRMLVAIAQSLLAADIVVVAVQNNMYNATKRLLTAALDMKSEVDADVIARLKPLYESGKINEKTYKSNVAFPMTSEVFPTSNMRNCGFAITSGGQHIIYLPIDEPKAQETVLGSLYDYLGDIVDTYVRTSALEYRHTEIIKRTAEKFYDSSVKVALACIHGGEYIKNKLNGLGDLGNCFIFDSNNFRRENKVVKKYITETAQKVRLDNNTLLGVAISNIYSKANKSIYIYIAIADSKGTKLIKLYGEDGESTSSLTSVCIDKLMLMLYDYDIDENGNNIDVPDNEETKSLKNTLTVATSGIVGASTATGLALAYIMK